MGLSYQEHIRRASEYEKTAALLTVRGLQHIQSPDPFWDLAEVHRERARRIKAAAGK